MWRIYLSENISDLLVCNKMFEIGVIVYCNNNDKIVTIQFRIQYYLDFQGMNRTT